MVDDGVGRLFEVAEAEPAVKAAAGAGAAKKFRVHDQGQSFLLPPSLDDWLPEGHTARFVSEVVDDMLDLTAIYASYTSDGGAAVGSAVDVEAVDLRVLDRGDVVT